MSEIEHRWWRILLYNIGATLMAPFWAWKRSKP